MRFHYKNINRFFRASILAGVVLCVISLPVSAIGWGAITLAEKHRPQRSWISEFASTPDIVATGFIADAIDRCDVITGPGNHCVIDVSNSRSGFPLEIFRSKTKLIGMKGMEPLTSNQNEIFIYIGDDTQNVIIDNLNIQGHSVAGGEIYGIIVEGQNISNIMLSNNKIHGFDSDENAHGIAVYGIGDSQQNAIHDIIIEGNHIYSMRTGSSESIAVNGNVRRWEVTGNHIHDVNNIVIVAIAGEGVSPTLTTQAGRVLPGIFDTARYGFIENNLIENMSTLGNPAYGNEETWAGAIYIDGGQYINIAGNVAINTAWAYDIGAENCVFSRNITLTGNSASGSSFGDLLLGGYAETGYLEDTGINCDPENTLDENEGHGYTSHLTIKENLFISTGTQLDPVTLQYRIRHAITDEMSVMPENAGGTGAASGDENAIKQIFIQKLHKARQDLKLVLSKLYFQSARYETTVPTAY